MEVDVEGLIRCIRNGDEDGILSHLQDFNKEYAQCFFFNAEERERSRLRKLEEFRRNKVREYVDSDSDYEEDSLGARSLVVRQGLAAVLLRFSRATAPARLTRVCRRSLCILFRDQKVLGPLLSDASLLAMARLAGLTAGVEEDDSLTSDLYDEVIDSLATPTSGGEKPACGNCGDRDNDDHGSDHDDDGDVGGGGNYGDKVAGGGRSPAASAALRGGANHRANHRALELGRRDRRRSQIDGEEEQEEEEQEEAQRKEAMKVLCNVVYNSAWAQERFSSMRFLCGLMDWLSNSASSSSGHFYELRLLFLLMALRPELRSQLQQEGGVSVLTEMLERYLQVRWTDHCEVLLDPTAPPILLEASRCAVEILKVLFNITYSAHRQEPQEVRATTPPLNMAHSHA